MFMNLGFLNADWMKAPVLQAVRDLRPLAAEAGVSLPQFALAWVLRQPNVASAIVGASRAAQIDDKVAASGADIAPQLFARAEALLSGAGM